jgi:hypothetical protein
MAMFNGKSPFSIAILISPEGISTVVPASHDFNGGAIGPVDSPPVDRNLMILNGLYVD